MERYARQIVLPEIGEEGQKRLNSSSALIIGVGALGTVQATFLARAGIGKIILVDRDVVELNNLQRQVLFDESDVGHLKAKAAEEHLKKVNSEIEIIAESTDFNFSNAEKIVEQVDIVIDGTDNMETRYLLNDVCIKLKKPWVYGGAVGTSGMVLAFMPGGLCFRCVFPQPPTTGDLPTCDTAGVLNTLPAFISALQITECYKILLGQAPSEKMLAIDLWSHEVHELEILPDPECPACSKNDFQFLNPETKKLYTSICGRNAVQIVPDKAQEISLSQLSEKLRAVGQVEVKPGVLLFKSAEAELMIFQDGRAMVKGTNDPVKAKTILSKFIGD